MEAAEASKKVTEDEQAAKEKITDTHTQARIGAEQSMQNAMQQTLNATKADNERTQRRIAEWNKSAEAIEDAQQRAHEAIINQARINGADQSLFGQNDEHTSLHC